jgi:hypothetical protein
MPVSPAAHHSAAAMRTIYFDFEEESMATALRALIVEDSENDCMLLLSILRRGG